MKLQVIFISDLLKPSSNTIKECYCEGKKDRFTFSTYKWLNIKHNNIVLKVWHKFLSNIITTNRDLQSPVNTTNRVHTHYQSSAYISLDSQTLALKYQNNFTYYQLETVREKIKITEVIPKPSNMTFNPCECTISAQYLHLFPSQRSQIEI